MTDPAPTPPADHTGKALMEFTYRFLTVMLDRDLMSMEEAVDFSTGVGSALDSGRQTPGAITRLQDAMARAKERAGAGSMG